MPPAAATQLSVFIRGFLIQKPLRKTQRLLFWEESAKNTFNSKLEYKLQFAIYFSI
ncbi:hypothetical protein Astex_2917 [Asticcacaulis excentricus CB 48]|uniref:Uncharacterized protein n=1 Tax=Asticcacaulis excentricus (strain ATCC 15261 / DSM 4724 / KCTC 12464 / NCIMB 9791 / VKM B-1370 / CB 48) TaxID=573065 RepID=E8RST3_ASTEC|nr:hypothetical protein Astex_2917 [Asticcacaulis excentricus CB 48]